jgi:hypothetical protein
VPGTFVQLIEFGTGRIGEWDAIAGRWAVAIGAQRAVRWTILGADRDRAGYYVAVVEFPGYAEAMANSDHPATAAFLKELQAICTSEPRSATWTCAASRPPTDRTERPPPMAV